MQLGCVRHASAVRRRLACYRIGRSTATYATRAMTDDVLIINHTLGGVASQTQGYSDL